MELDMRKLLVLIFCFIFAFSGRIFSEDITILFATDTHSNLSPAAPRTAGMKGTVGGIARAATLIKQTKLANPNTLLLHGGDAFIGDLVFNTTFGVAELEMMQILGYDAMVLGNHEFDLTSTGLLGVLSVADPSGSLSLLCANLNLANPDVAPLQNFVGALMTKEVGTVKVGIFGMTTPQTNFYSQSSIVLENIDSVALLAVDSLKKLNCKIIICLSHLGIYNDRQIARDVTGIDLIIGGHDHLLFTNPETFTHSGKTTYYVQAGAFYRTMGKIDISYNNDAIETLNYNYVNIDSSLAENAQIKYIVDSLETGVNNAFGLPCYSQQVGYAENMFWEINPNLLNEGYKDTPVGNLVTDAFIAAVPSADIAIEPGGSTAQPLYTGQVTASDIFRMIGYGFSEASGTQHYKLVTFDLNGLQLIGGLHIALQGIDLDDELFVQCSGLEYSYYVNHNADDRLIYDSVRIKGVPIQITSTYKIVTNEFVAALFAGMLGSALPNLVVIDTITEFSAVMNYIIQHQVVIPKNEGRVKALVDPNVGVEEISVDKQELSIYPNPAKGTAVIKFEAAEPGVYSMKIYNSFGQEISNVFTQTLEKGIQSKTLNVSGLSSGLYFVRLTNGRITNSTKMIVD
jgi:5'-nucleotidase/UDP-sugar diphosphatase